MASRSFLGNMPAGSAAGVLALATPMVTLAAGYILASAFQNKKACKKAAKVAPAITYPDKLPADENQAFLEVADMLTAEILDELATKYDLPSEAVKWVADMIAYNVKGGKLNRGLTVVAVKRTIDATAGKPLSPQEFARASVLGWCIEWLQAFFLVADDVMDDSITRRGQPCWFRQPHVKLIAINDAFILESNVFQVLKHHFGHESFYETLFDLFREVTLQTEVGQLLDLTSQPMDGKIDLNRFTIERYKLIVKYKTAFYTFYLPVACGLIMSGVVAEESLSIARKICLIMGEYFQIQDDYLDCYGDPKVIGKVGTDIQDNKCSWLVVQALDRATPDQRKILEEHYGQHSDESVATVKKLYKELELEALFKTYEEDSYRAIIAELDRLDGRVPRQIFEQLLQKIYKRSK